MSAAGSHRSEVRRGRGALASRTAEGQGRARRNSGRYPAGFTAVELLIATVIMALVVLGVYGVFRQALVNEENVSSRWRDLQGAVVVADLLAEAVEAGATLPGIAAVRGGRADDGKGFELVCLAAGSAGGGVPLRLVRFRWGLSEAEGGLFRQTRRMAGTADLTSPPGPDDGATEAERWARLPLEKVGDGLNGLRVDYRPVADADAQWRRRWTRENPPAVRITVRVGAERVQRLAAPRTRGPLVPDTSGGG